MISEFIDGLLNFHFLQNALITALVIGIVGGAVGCFIILRGMSLMGDAISHAVLPGVAISFILGINFFIGAIIFGLLASTMITYIKSNSIIKSDTAIGITFSSFLALGIILIGVANSSTDLFHILFGNILAVQDMDMWITIIVSLLVLASIFFFMLFPEEMEVKSIFGKTKRPLDKTSSKVQKRYEQSGLSKQEIDYFRQKMSVVKTQIQEIDETIQSLTKLRIISNRYNTTVTMKDYFKELVAHPEKLPEANLFVHTCVPSLNEMTKVYKELSEQPVKGSETYQTLQELGEKIDLVCATLEEDYLHFQEDKIKKSEAEMDYVNRTIKE